MKKLLSIITILLLALNTFAQTPPATPPAGAAPATEQVGNPGLHEVIKQRFIDGGLPFMTPILITLVLGLTICIERIIYLNRAHASRRKLLAALEPDILAGNWEKAKETCRNTRGPLATMLLHGLERSEYGADVMEKSIITSGNAQMNYLERGLTWISLFISLAPIFGFFGTVIGIFMVFENIELTGDVSVSVVAGGMKVKLINTIGGLIVAMVLQIFYNYVVAKIDSVVHDMEEGAITFVDLMLKSPKFKN